MNTNDHASAVADMQRRGMRSALALGRATTGMFERLARQNYAVMGDVVDYTLSQLRIPTVHADPRSALEAQAAGTRAAVEKARMRATEYAAIAGEMRDVAGSAAGSVGSSGPRVAPVRAPAPASAPAASSAASGDTPAARPSAAAGNPAGISPIIVPGDSPKAVARKLARAADVPATRAIAKKTVAKKAVAKKTAAKKTAAKKAAAKKAAAKKAAGKAGTKRAAVGVGAKKATAKASAKKRATSARGGRGKKG